jgi:DNA polymerase
MSEVVDALGRAEHAVHHLRRAREVLVAERRGRRELAPQAVGSIAELIEDPEGREEVVPAGDGVEAGLAAGEGLEQRVQDLGAGLLLAPRREHEEEVATDLSEQRAQDEAGRAHAEGVAHHRHFVFAHRRRLHRHHVRGAGGGGTAQAQDRALAEDGAGEGDAEDVAIVADGQPAALHDGDGARRLAAGPQPFAGGEGPRVHGKASMSGRPVRCKRRWHVGCNETARGGGMPKARTTDGSSAGTAAVLVPEHPTWPRLKDVAAGCRACDLWERGTQTVFGEGARPAKVMFVGEQPGNDEDIAGRPFVGPAGKLLDRALTEADIDRSDVYVTNVVKHFKWEPRGKRRIHAKPNASEIRACRPWLVAEVEVVHPRLIVCLGATAAQSIIGRDFRVSRQRGEVVPSPLGPLVTATVHPSSILRAPDDLTRRTEMKRFIEDLRKIAKFLEP